MSCGDRQSTRLIDRQTEFLLFCQHYLVYSNALGLVEFASKVVSFHIRAVLIFRDKCYSRINDTQHITAACQLIPVKSDLSCIISVSDIANID